MYAIGPIPWINIFLVIGIYLLIILCFNFIMRKYLKVDKRKTFSYNHVNEKHKRIDWTIRIIFMITLMILTFIGVYKYNNEGLWKLMPSILFVIFLMVSEAVRAFMEWKYATNPKAYIFTISQTVIMLILFPILIKLLFLILS